MREDQYHRLQALEEKLTEQFLFEAEPANWPADGVHPKDMTQEDRGNRYWCKKNAVATISLTIRIGTLIGKVQGIGIVTPPADSEGEDTGTGLLDAEVAAAEAEAKKLLKKLQAKSKAAAS